MNSCTARLSSRSLLDLPGLVLRVFGLIWGVDGVSRCDSSRSISESYWAELGVEGLDSASGKVSQSVGSSMSSFSWSLNLILVKLAFLMISSILGILGVDSASI